MSCVCTQRGRVVSYVFPWRAAFLAGTIFAAPCFSTAEAMGGDDAAGGAAAEPMTGRRRRRRGSKGGDRTHGGKRHKRFVLLAQRRRRVKRIMLNGALDAELTEIVSRRREARQAADDLRHGGGGGRAGLGVAVGAAPSLEAPGTSSPSSDVTAAAGHVVGQSAAAAGRRRARPTPRGVRAQREECAALRRRSTRLLLLGSSVAEVSLVEEFDLEPLYLPDPDLHKQDKPRCAIAAYLAAVCWPRAVAAAPLPAVPSLCGRASSPGLSCLCDDLVICILEYNMHDASAMSMAAMACSQWRTMVASIQRAHTHRRVAMAGAAAAVRVQSADAIRVAARASARVVVAMFYDRYSRYVPFSGRLEERLVGSTLQISVCFDSVACADGLYELSYRAERRLFACTQGRENEIDPEDPPPMAILSDFYSTRVEAMLTEADLVHYYANKRGRGARFDAPASLAERALAPTMAAITAWNEEMGEASAESGSEAGTESWIVYGSSSSSSGGDSDDGDLEDGGEAGGAVRAELHDLLDRSCQEQDGQVSCAPSKLEAPVHFARPPVGPP